MRQVFCVLTESFITGNLATERHSRQLMIRRCRLKWSRHHSGARRKEITACPESPETDSFVTAAALLYPAFRILHWEAAIDSIPHAPRLAAFHHRTRHIGHRPAYSRGVVHPLSVGPQLEPWAFERARKAHLAAAPHRHRNGASNEFVISRRSTGHRRASRSRLSPTACCPTNRCYPERCSSQCCGSDARHGSTRRATTCNSVANRPAGFRSRA
jgi:hypothetical protein